MKRNGQIDIDDCSMLGYVYFCRNMTKSLFLTYGVEPLPCTRAMCLLFGMHSIACLYHNFSLLAKYYVKFIAIKNVPEPKSNPT